MSVGRVLLSAAFGALAGGGAAVALIQSGQLESSTTSVVASAGAAAFVSAIATALARFRIVRVLLVGVAIVLSVLTFVVAQTPAADALAAQGEPCAVARVGEALVQGTPRPGALGSAERPIRLAVDDEVGVTVEIRTRQPFTTVMIEATIVEPVDIRRSVELSSDNLVFEDGRAIGMLEIVEMPSGLSVRVGSQTVPLPFGTARLEGTFSSPDSRAPVEPCPFVLHVQLVTSAFDTLAGRIALAAVAVGALGVIAIALTGASGGAGVPGTTGGASRPTPPVPRPSTRPSAPQPQPAPSTRPPPPQSPPAPSTRPPAPGARPTVPQRPSAPGARPPQPQQAPATRPPASPPPAAPAASPPPASASPPPAAPAASPPPASASPPPAPPAASPPPASASPPPAPPAASPPPASASPPPAPPGPPPSTPAGAVVAPSLGLGPEPEAPEPERFVQLRIEVDDFPEQGFVSGATNKLSFWIGPEIVDDYVQRASHAVPEAGRTITLDAQFVWPDGDASGTMTLNVDSSKRSDPKFEVIVDIAPTASRFIGTLYLWVRETNRLYEQVKVLGPAGLAGHEDRPKLLSIVEDREHIERLGDDSPSIGACVVHEGDTLFWYTNAEPAIRDARNLMTVEANLASAVANLQARAGRIDWADDASLTLLRTLAVEGAKLRYAVAGDIEPGPAFQFYNQQHKTTVPFEWVYDRGFTADDATIEPACVASLHQGLDSGRSVDDPFPCGCPPASALSSDQRLSNNRLCPWGFWGLSKVIERYDTEPLLVNNVPHPDDDALLPRFSSILLAANDTLDVASGRPGEVAIDVVAQLNATATTRRVHTWADFRAELTVNDADLVVTLPHQETDTLQIGTDQLHLSQVPDLLDESHDRVILLLGCKTTQAASVGFASFGRIFKDHAAVVVGSSATLVTSDAARIAIKLVQQLTLVASSGEPLGHAVIAARQQLFADGYPIALAVTALGDADWRFASQVLEPA